MEHLREKVKQAIINHAKEQYPKESCGLLIRRKENNEVYYFPCDNIADNPFETFEINPDDIINLNFVGNIVGVVHSHTNGRNYLSKYDMHNQRIFDYDWYLVCGEQIIKYRSIEPLLGRKFVFNKSDCYDLFRDSYMLSGIDFPQFSYVENWYELGQNLYVDNLKQYDFEQVSQPELGDVVLFQIGSDIPNHCGVYLDNGYFLHHATNQLSKRDLLGGYWLKHTHSIWRYKWKSKLNFMAILENLEMNLD